MKDRALALAGLLQAVHLVQQMAQTGQAESAPLAASIDSLFRFDAETPEAVFDGAAKLRPGLARLAAWWPSATSTTTTRCCGSPGTAW